MKSAFLLIVSYLTVLLQLAGKGGSDLFFTTKCVTMAIALFISVRLILLQVLKTETQQLTD